MMRYYYISRMGRVPCGADLGDWQAVPAQHGGDVGYAGPRTHRARGHNGLVSCWAVSTHLTLLSVAVNKLGTTQVVSF